MGALPRHAGGVFKPQRSETKRKKIPIYEPIFLTPTFDPWMGRIIKQGFFASKGKSFGILARVAIKNGAVDPGYLVLLRASKLRVTVTDRALDNRPIHYR